MKFLDLFAGIGGFRLGMEAAGHECVGFCEIDKFARASYKAIHDTKGEIELHDITAVSDDTVRGIGRVDVICGGFPCQAFSIAGKRQGFEDTRGTLFFEIARFASILRPRLLFLKNVKGLLNHNGGDTFETILSALDELGYDAEWQVLNSKNFGVPQNRERVFIVGHLRGASTRGVFPFGRESQSISNQSVVKIGNVNPSGNGMNGEVYQADGLEPKIIQRRHGYNQGGEHDIAPTLTSNSYQENNVLRVKEATAQGYAEAENGDSVNLAHPNSKIRRGRVGKGQANTLLTGESQGVVTPDFRIRKLTPRECWRLQGFPDWAFDKAQEVNSNSQLYKQAGNSVTVNVIEAIARELG
jgi:DNA (cytosine-5)-methyltransferase 1